MKARSAVLAGLASALACLLGFILSGVPLLQRGPWAVACFGLCGLAFILGVALYVRAVTAWHWSGVPTESYKAPVPPPVPAPQGVNLEAFEQLQARVEVCEKKLTGLSFLAGRFGRMGAMRAATAAPESPK